MNSISRPLLVSASLSTAIPVLKDNTQHKIIGNEAMVKDFAVFTGGNHLGNLPPHFTICSSVGTEAFLSGLSPFQLFYDNGTPWISLFVYSGKTDSTYHRIRLTVSSMLLQSLKRA